MAQHALELTQRPGNMIRAGLSRGPGSMLPALQGQIHVDPTELPFVKGLPDQGPQMGPVHITPKTVAGFAGGMALDPLSYLIPELMASGPLASLTAKAAGFGPFGVFAAQNADDLVAPLARSMNGQGDAPEEEDDKPEPKSQLDPRIMNRSYQPKPGRYESGASMFNAPSGYGT